MCVSTIAYNENALNDCRESVSIQSIVIDTQAASQKKKNYEKSHYFAGKKEREQREKKAKILDVIDKDSHWLHCNHQHYHEIQWQIVYTRIIYARYKYTNTKR